MSNSQQQVQQIKFAGVLVKESHTFHRGNHVFAMVPHNQICEGHVLLAPFESDKNYHMLTTPELFELVLAMKQL